MGAERVGSSAVWRAWVGVAESLDRLIREFSDASWHRSRDVGGGIGSTALRPASQIFRNGASLTGQSDHIVNGQIGIEDKSSLSQLTFLFNYASERITNRGPGNLSGVGFLPDIFERPGFRFDIVARQGAKIGPAEFEIKLEGRNLSGTGYREFQRFPNGTEVFINRYRVGRTVSLGISAKL